MAIRRIRITIHFRTVGPVTRVCTKCDPDGRFGRANLVSDEHAIYQSLSDFLVSEFAQNVKPRFGSCRVFVEDTARLQAPNGGRWSRPDVSAIAIIRARFEPNVRIELMTFEVKTQRGGSQLTSVYEALSHNRFANRSFLVWNRDTCTCEAGDSFNEIDACCDSNGIGLITVHDPNDRRTFKIWRDARLRSLDPRDLDEFIVSRFSEVNQRAIETAISQFMSRGP
ncbi:MAG: hypothetical protein NW216_05480 [Hyphomicrobium sp.]|nr:hypothetical protein [Hyphomicrobium sp.]